MGRLLTILVSGILGALATGCASSPTLDVPLAPGEKLIIQEQNPVFIPLGPQPEAYAKLFENMLQILGDYGFEIQDAQRPSGEIYTLPRVAPGLLLFMKPGSPDISERTLATLQTYRHRVSVRIDPADNGGYFVQVVVLKELEDRPRPLKQTAGAAIFRFDNTVERQFEVVDIMASGPGWVYKGRDTALEQRIIETMKKLM